MTTDGEEALVIAGATTHVGSVDRVTVYHGGGRWVSECVVTHVDLPWHVGTDAEFAGEASEVAW
jgi:hypothetical protein